MIRKLFVGVAIAGLMSLGIALSVRSVQAQSQPDRSDKQEQKATKSISGKMTNIGIYPLAAASATAHDDAK